MRCYNIRFFTTWYNGRYKDYDLMVVWFDFGIKGLSWLWVGNATMQLIACVIFNHDPQFVLHTGNGFWKGSMWLWLVQTFHFIFVLFCKVFIKKYLPSMRVLSSFTYQKYYLVINGILIVFFKGVLEVFLGVDGHHKSQLCWFTMYRTQAIV